MDGWRLITHQFSRKAFIRCSRLDWDPALPYCNRNQNQGTFFPCEGFSTLLHGQCMFGSVLRMVSITPLQMPGVCQEHSDFFLAAAVGFGTGHHKLDTGYESPPGPVCRGKGLTPGSAIAQAEITSCRVPRRQNPPQLWGKMCLWQQEETASIQSHGDCGWWHVLVKEQGVASRGGRSREQHYPKSILSNRCFQLQDSAWYSLETTTSVHSKAFLFSVAL